MSVMGEKPKMTAEEADARFAALVAQHRGEQSPRRASEPGMSKMTPMKALVVVYVIGVVTGIYALAKPLLAVIVGVPVLLACRAWLKRSGHLES